MFPTWEAASVGDSECCGITIHWCMVYNHTPDRPQDGLGPVATKHFDNHTRHQVSLRGVGRGAWGLGFRAWGFGCEVWSFRIVKRFRGGLALKAHKLVYHSTLSLRVIKMREEDILIILVITFDIN